MIDINTLKDKLNTDPERLPLLTLDEFFEDNHEEDSIAPNQWGEGRPSLQEISEYYSLIPEIPQGYLCFEIVWD